MFGKNKKLQPISSHPPIASYNLLKNKLMHLLLRDYKITMSSQFFLKCLLAFYYHDTATNG